MTSEGLKDGTRVGWPTLVVIGALVFLVPVSISIGRTLERQDRVEIQQAKAADEQEKLDATMTRIDERLRLIQESVSVVPNLEARIIALEGETVRLEREHRLLRDRVERKLGITTDTGDRP